MDIKSVYLMERKHVLQLLVRVRKTRALADGAPG